jgi:hypothetical protein
MMQVIKYVERDVFVRHSPEWRGIEKELKLYNAVTITRVFFSEKGTSTMKIQKKKKIRKFHSNEF